MKYSPETGELLWLVNRVKAKRGAQVGAVNGAGYLETRVDQYRTYAHRIAWALHYGSWPKQNIDHINGRRTDNRIANLRDVSQSGNMHNVNHAERSNASPLGTGVSRKRDRFQAILQIDGRRRSVGVFDTPEEAHAAYLAARARLAPLPHHTKGNP